MAQSMWDVRGPANPPPWKNNTLSTHGMGINEQAGQSSGPANPPPWLRPGTNDLSTSGMGMNEQTGQMYGQKTGYGGPTDVIPSGTGGTEPQPVYSPANPRVLQTGGLEPQPVDPNDRGIIGPANPPVYKGGGQQPSGFRGRPQRTNFWQQITQLARPSVTTAPASAQRQQQISNAARNRAAFLAGFGSVRRGWQ